MIRKLYFTKKIFFGIFLQHLKMYLKYDMEEGDVIGSDFNCI